MDREILFRGKRIDNQEWVDGCYMTDEQDSTTAYIGHIFGVDGGMIIHDMDVIRVDPETVCQYTGLTDKNGRKIFEGDICKYYNSEDKDGIAVIREDYAEWKSGTIRQKEIMTPLFYLKCSEEWEVIGNIFDNPGLLEGGAE